MGFLLFFPMVISLLIPFGPSADFTRHPPTLEWVICFTETIDINVHPAEDGFQETLKIIVD